MKRRVALLNPEQFKEVPGWSKYLINPQGTHVYNNDTKHYLKLSKPVINGKETGYIYCTLIDKGYRFKRVAVHKLVLLTFEGPQPPNKPWVNHKDGNRDNNHIDNLHWSTISENIRHSFDVLGRTTPTGKDHWRYGKKHSYTTKKKLSEAKKGEKHPRFKGYYIVNGRKYPSANQASKDLNIPCMTILRRTKNPNFPEYYFLEAEKLNNK
jgi:hypothetical protein